MPTAEELVAKIDAQQREHQRILHERAETKGAAYQRTRQAHITKLMGSMPEYLGDEDDFCDMRRKSAEKPAGHTVARWLADDLVHVVYVPPGKTPPAGYARGAFEGVKRDPKPVAAPVEQVEPAASMALVAVALPAPAYQRSFALRAVEGLIRVLLGLRRRLRA